MQIFLDNPGKHFESNARGHAKWMAISRNPQNSFMPIPGCSKITIVDQRVSLEKSGGCSVFFHNSHLK